MYTFHKSKSSEFESLFYENKIVYFLYCLMNNTQRLSIKKHGKKMAFFIRGFSRSQQNQDKE